MTGKDEMGYLHDMPINSIEEIKCALCKNFLSYFPIFISLDQQNICGRCTSSQDKLFMRNSAYEAVSQFLRFPCQYKNKGCVEELLPNDVPQHEKTCPHRIIKCPTMDSTLCKWEGNCIELSQHCHEKHFDLILQNGDLKIDLSHEYDNILLLRSDNILFIMKNIFDFNAKVLKCAIFRIPDDISIEHYSCQLNVKNSSRSLSVEFFTTTSEDTNFIELSLESIKTPSENFPSYINGKITVHKSNDEKVKDDLKSVLEISQLTCMKCSVCSSFVLPPIYGCRGEQDILCSSCVDGHLPNCYECVYTGAIKNINLEEVATFLNYPCKNKKNGCSVIAKVDEIKKHQEICLFGETECPINDFEMCIWKGLKRGLKSHIEESHQDMIKHNGSEISLDLNIDQYSTLISFSNCLFRLIFIRQNELNFWCTVQTISHVIESFQCEVEIIDKNNSSKRLIIRMPCYQLIKKEQLFIDNNFGVLHYDQIQHFLLDYKLAIKINIHKR